MRYLVFTFGEYYPSGGCEDFRGSTDTLPEAKKKAFEYSDEYKHILDTRTGECQEFIDGDWKVKQLYVPSIDFLVTS